MTPEWLLFAGLCLVWVVYAARPLFSREDPRHADERRRLVETKRGLLFALRDAEIDFQGGKLSEADYTSIRRRLEAEALTVIERLDGLEGGSPEARVERAIDALKARGRDA